MNRTTDAAGDFSMRGAIMKPSTKPFVRIVFLFLLMLLLSFACNLPGSQESSQTMALKEENGVVSGSLPYPEGEGVQKVLFTVSEDGQATFRLDGAPESETLTVNLIDDQTAGLSWQGTILDGAGELTGEEQAALDNLLAGELGYGLAMVPLDAACRGEIELSPKQMAALLVPLQMQFKYSISNRSEAALDLITASSCDYGDREENQSEYPTQIMFSPSMPVPVVFGYFPFDEVGAVEQDASSSRGPGSACLRPEQVRLERGDLAANLYGGVPGELIGISLSEIGPCNALCRGACGADCEPENCTKTVEHRCERDAEGRKTGMDERYLIYECGMHQGCIEHDACYDTCNEIYGCDSWLATACRHSFSSDLQWARDHEIHFCDQKAILTYGPGTAYDWAYGGGDQPLRETFEYRDEAYGLQQNFRKCNIEDTKEPTISNKDVPVGVYNGTVRLEGWLVKKSRTITEVISNQVRFVVSEDGTVSGTLELITDEEFVASSGNTVYITEVYQGTFSGQLTEPQGTVEILLVKLTSGGSDSGWLEGENNLEWVADIQISGSSLTGTVGPFSTDNYFGFEATRE